MNHPPARMRIRSTTMAGTALALVAALGAQGSAIAEPVTIRDAKLYNDASWSFTTTEPGRTMPGRLHAISEGDLEYRTDALDSAFELSVGGKPYGAASPGNLEGSRLTGPTQKLAGLRTKVTYEAIPATSTLRVLVTLTNTTRKRIVRDVRLGTDLASDDTTAVLGTADEDQLFTAKDRWVATSQTNGDSTQPIVMQAYAGRGGQPLSSARVDDDVVRARTRVAVPARSTRNLLLFLAVAPTMGTANPVVGRFNERVPETLLGGLSAEDRLRVLNWDLSPI